MFPVRTHLSLAACLIDVLQTKQNFKKVKTSLILNDTFMLDFGKANIILKAIDPIYDERSDNPQDSIKPIFVRITRLEVISKYIEVSISYNTREHTFICESFQYTV